MTSKNLLIMPFGKKSLRSPWLSDTAGRRFDVVLLCYHEMPDEPLLAHPAVTAYQLNDFKWWMIAALFETVAPALATQYEQFYFIDDDIETTKADINFLFDCFAVSPFVMAQPGLTSDSFMSWDVLRGRSLSGHRYVTSIELMCPLMKRDALLALLPIFRLTKSGWGVDLLWGKQVRERFGPERIGVFDVVHVRHGRPVGKGELYDKLDTTARAEEDRVRATYQLEQFGIDYVRTPKNRRLPRLMSYLAYRARWCLAQLRSVFASAAL